MARTKQTARKSTGGKAPRKQLAAKPMQDEEVIDNPDLDDEEVQRLKEIAEGSMRAELKYLDKKFTEHGQTYYAETVEEDVPEQVAWNDKFALCLVRHMDGDHNHPYVSKVSLQVNSQHVKDLLKDTIPSYPGISFDTRDVTIDKPYHVLYHYRKEIEEAGKAFEYGSEAADHLDLLLEFINEEFKDVIEETENLLEQNMINHQYLWTIFLPGTTIYAPFFGQARAFKLNSYAYTVEGFQVSLEFVDFSGDDLGTRVACRLIEPFSGSQQISKLSAMPIEWYPFKDGLKQQLIARGRRWEQLAGMHFQEYKGVALEYNQCGGIDRYNIDGRVVVDTKTYHRLNANLAFHVAPFKSDEEKRTRNHRIQNLNALDLVPVDKLDVDPLTDEQCMMANATVRGFSFSEKRWLDFFVDKLSAVNWNTHSFDELVLPSAPKDLVKALVTTHVQQRSSFDDIVKGKGKGLIMVLHGPPGVGKTLTAETVAEYCKRPLYMVSSGDLGTSSSTLDQKLSRILDLASTWKAVLLIDEADIFLERRSLHDMERNSLVSIFLRVLEYYEGILFLTSNRVNTFDDAFKSRIHVPLKYDDLTVDSRKKIWKNFLTQGETSDVEMDEKGYESLAQAEINGRQIKNVIRTAKSLAQFHGQKLDREKLEQVIGIQMEFEQELDLTKTTKGVNGHPFNGD